jgi:phosphoribosylglycinamide formyltransferase-1
MSDRNPLRLAVMVSGTGSNLQAIIDRFHLDDEEARTVTVALVISDREGAYGLERAQNAGIDTIVIAPSDYGGSDEFGEKLIETYKRFEIEYIVLAGYLKMIPANVVKCFRNRIINIHPALLPLFGGKGMYGIHVHRAVLESGMKVSGATIHFVDEIYDHGPIIAQETIPVYSDDTPESLAARVLEVEHRLLPDAIELIASGSVSVEEGIARVKRDKPGTNQTG